MRRSELVREVGKDTGFPQKLVKVILASIENTITKELADSGDVTLRGFGAFRAVGMGCRTGRNPATGEEVHVDPYKQIYFRAGTELKEAVNERD